MAPTQAAAVAMAVFVGMAAGAMAAGGALARATGVDALAAPGAPHEAARLSSQFSDWAGGRSNADSLVAGLRNATPITLITNVPGQAVRFAGFRTRAPMTYAAVRSALSEAQRSLARAGINKPNAEQIQAVLTGGDVGTQAPAIL
jgi:hypothetical protein